MTVIIEFPEVIVTFFLCCALGGAILLVVIVMTSGVSNVQRVRRREKWSTLAKDVVVLHQMPRGKRTPGVDAQALKLETFLRMNSITYENDFEEPQHSASGACPWITVNGEDIPHSEICVEYLKKKTGRDDAKQHYSSEQRALGLSVQRMLENHFAWAAPLWRNVYAKDGVQTLQSVIELPWYRYYMARYFNLTTKGDAKGHGIGRLDEDQAREVLEKDLYATSAILGNKKFILGDEICEYDCAIFGVLAQAVWGLPGTSFEKIVNNELTNLREYCNRIRDLLWPDWKRCLRPPVTD